MRSGLPAGRPVRGQQLILSHDPQHPLSGNRDPLHEVQPHPHLSVTLSVEGRGRQIPANEFQQLLIAHHGSRSPPTERPLGAPQGPLRPFIKRGASLLPDLTYSLDPVGPTTGLGDRLTHFDDLLRAKGPVFSRTRRHSSSFSIVTSPSRLNAASNSPWSGFPSRSRSPASIPDSAWSRHCSSR